MVAGELESRLRKLAENVAVELRSQDKKCVFAESCTGGKMAAAITGVPGISGYFCGSAVTYRESCKTSWLGVSASVLSQHSAESAETTVAMARAVLEKTIEANCSVAITGHLGPGVDDAIDGRIFVVCAHREDASRGPIKIVSSSHQLTADNRQQRQTEAACAAFEDFLVAIEGS